MNPVWIIDDDRSIRWVFEKALAREGIEHRTFEAAQEALDCLPGEAPQVVVSDIRMPGLSGLELMQQLKSRLPETPVIIMTAYSDLESAVAAFQGGAFEYLPKPFDVDHAVMMMTGVEGSFSFSCCMNSSPLMPGMRMSLTTTCGVSSESLSMASCAALKVRCGIPSRSSAFSNTHRIERSSSMIQTGFMASSRAFIACRCASAPAEGW